MNFLISCTNVFDFLSKQEFKVCILQLFVSSSLVFCFSCSLSVHRGKQMHCQGVLANKHVVAIDRGRLYQISFFSCLITNMQPVAYGGTYLFNFYYFVFNCSCCMIIVLRIKVKPSVSQQFTKNLQDQVQTLILIPLC